MKSCWDFFKKQSYSPVKTEEIELDYKPVVTTKNGKRKIKFKTRIKSVPSEYYIAPKEETETKRCCL